MVFQPTPANNQFLYKNMTTQAYFENIQPHIIKELLNAKKSIFIAVAWFTDDKLFKILCEKAKEGVTVSTLILNDGINTDFSGLNHQELRDAGGEIFLIGSKEELMHNKFCVIDQEIVITGSYNWTKKAQSNDENITITIGSKELATDFIMEFQRLQKKYLGHCIKIKLDIETLLKRLEILKTSISLQDEEDIEYQSKKSSKEIGIRELSEDLQILGKISDTISKKEYGECARIITLLIEKYKSIVVWTDPEINGLKLEIRSLELQISSLEDEKSDIEKAIFEFEIRYNKELGNLILEYLELKRSIAENQVKDEPNDEKAKKKYEETKKEYEEFKSNINTTKDIKILPLDDDQINELKTKFRKLSKLTHPDLVDKKFEKEASELFIRAKQAKDKNDLKTINEILDYLENGKPFILKHESINEKGLLNFETNRLRGILKKLIDDLTILKNSPTFQKISGIPNIAEYLNDIKNKLVEEIKQMKKEYQKGLYGQ